MNDMFVLLSIFPLQVEYNLLNNTRLLVHDIQFNVTGPKSVPCFSFHSSTFGMFSA